MNPIPGDPPPSLALRPPQSYTFTVPDHPSRKRRHKPSPGCSLCSILVNLEEEDREQCPTPPIVNHEQPLSPAIFSPGMFQRPLLSAQSARNRSNNGERVLVVDDQDLTAWIASPTERVANDGRHVVIAFKRHIEDVYAFGPHDIPLLSHALQTAHALLDRAPSSSPSTSSNKGKAKAVSENEVAPDPEDGGIQGFGAGQRRIGFLTGFTRDPQFPYSHLHIHAILGPYDAASWYRRTVTYNAWNPGWWALEDLVAEIRESTSNNRVKSGYGSRRNAPLAAVPAAGSRSGLPNALEPETRRANPGKDMLVGGSAPTAGESSTSRARTSDEQHNIPPALLDAVLRDAERAFGPTTGSTRRSRKGKQKEVSPAPEDGPNAIEGARQSEERSGTLTNGSVVTEGSSSSTGAMDRIPL